MKRILNKRTIREKEKFLVQWKEYTVRGDTWKSKENLKNARKLVKEFKREYGEEVEEIK